MTNIYLEKIASSALTRHLLKKFPTLTNRETTRITAGLRSDIAKAHAGAHPIDRVISSGQPLAKNDTWWSPHKGEYGRGGFHSDLASFDIGSNPTAKNAVRNFPNNFKNLTTTKKYSKSNDRSLSLEQDRGLTLRRGLEMKARLIKAKT